MHLGAGAHVRCHGKGRKDRITPLTATPSQCCGPGSPNAPATATDPLFPTRAGRPLSRDAVEKLVAKHAATAAASRPSIAAKNVTPHTLRHTYVISPGLNLVRDVGLRGWPGTCLTSIRNSFVPVATFAT